MAHATERSPLLRFCCLGAGTKLLPVVFMVLLISSLFGIYVFAHALPLLQQAGQPSDLFAMPSARTVQGELIAFCVVATLLVISYCRALLTNPGSIPDTAEWRDGVVEGEVEEVEESEVVETKRSGGPRFCKWCSKYKPDRAHHCRVCRTCVLRMDHHCPWIHNCVGFRNHKYFLLLVIYSAVECHFMSVTMFPSVHRAVMTEDNFGHLLVLLFGEALAVALGLLLTLFLGFHTYLTFASATTIEFCERQTRGSCASQEPRSAFDLGLYSNLTAVLGDNVLLWLLPLNPPSGSGLSFVTEQSRLNVTVEKEVPRRRTSSSRRPSKAMDPPSQPASARVIRSMEGGTSSGAASPLLLSGGTGEAGQAV